MVGARAILRAAVDYFRSNPDEAVHMAANAAALRVTVPLASLRWFAAQQKNAPRELALVASPPALGVSAVVDAMGTWVRVSGSIVVDEVAVEPSLFRVELRVRDVKLELAEDSHSAVATLIKSGALDLSRPGTLVKFLPKRPAFIAEAENDRFVIDLLKVPAIASDWRLAAALRVLSPVLRVRSLETEGDHLVLALHAMPGGVSEAFLAATSEFRRRLGARVERE